MPQHTALKLVHLNHTQHNLHRELLAQMTHKHVEGVLGLQELNTLFVEMCSQSGIRITQHTQYLEESDSCFGGVGGDNTTRMPHNEGH